MNNWWGKLSLKNKLQFPIQLILLSVLVAAQQTALNQFEKHVLSQAREKALVSADGVLNGLNMLMINGIISDAEQRALYVKKMGASDKVDELRVMRGKPVQNQFGPGLPSEQATDDMDRAALDSGVVQTQLTAHGEKQSLRVVVPFIAHKEFRGTNCLMCHNVTDGAINGATSITLDLTDEFALIQRANYVMWGVQLAAQLVLYFLIGWLISFMTRPVRELQLTMQAMQASGDLSKRAVVHNADEIGKTAQSFNDLAQGFQVIVSQVEGHAGRVVASSHRLAENAGQIAQGLQQQTDAAAVTSEAVSQVSISINHVADSAGEVARLSEESAERAHQGQTSMNDMMLELELVERAVNEIASSVSAFVSNTQSITNMTQQVRDIAEQTNLLALNAAIEAARAGEQGRGFAVVADEVRKLAEKSALSASQIDEVTQTIGTQSVQVDRTIQRGIGALQSSKAHIGEVNDVLTASSVTVDEVNRGMEEIVNSIKQQRDATHEIARNIERIAAMAKNSNQVVKSSVEEAHQMELISENLTETVGRFKV